LRPKITLTKNLNIEEIGQMLNSFLQPKSIAIIGVSKTPDRPGYMIIKNLKDFGFAGEIYPVNTEGGEVLGFKTYKNIQELPEKIDLAISMIPADETFDLLDNCSSKGISNVLLVSGGFVLLVSGGFSESGQRGAKLQNEVVKFAKQKGIRLMGPNAVGPVNTSNNLALPFYPLDSLKKGGVALIAQSGQFPVMEFMNSYLHVGVSKSIDLGNCCDIDEAEVLEYLEEDTETKVIAIYMESIREGKHFLDVAKRVSKKKPVVVFKSGKTADGLKTAASHTGAIAVDDKIFDFALKQAGVIRAKDLDEFLDLAKIFDYANIPKGNRAAIVTYSGGVGAMVADACEEFGLKLAELSKDTIKKIKPALPHSTMISNPLDCFSAGIPSDLFNAYRESLMAFKEAPTVDVILSCFLVSRIWTIDVNRLLSELEQFPVKPMVAWVIGDYSRVGECTKILEENRVPVFASPERAVRALGALWKYYTLSRQ
jgi:acyl-CoA synthetase (NDP forming)